MLFSSIWRLPDPKRAQLYILLKIGIYLRNSYIFIFICIFYILLHYNYFFIIRSVKSATNIVDGFKLF